MLSTWQQLVAIPGYIKAAIMTICPLFYPVHLSSENQKKASQTKMDKSNDLGNFKIIAPTKGVVVYRPRIMDMVDKRRQLFDSVALKKEEERSNKPLSSGQCFVMRSPHF